MQDTQPAEMTTNTQLAEMTTDTKHLLPTYWKKLANANNNWKKSEACKLESLANRSQMQHTVTRKEAFLFGDTTAESQKTGNLVKSRSIAAIAEENTASCHL
eukprot:5010731-Amphidinium_carterae.1